MIQQYHIVSEYIAISYQPPIEQGHYECNKNKYRRRADS